LVTGSGVRPLNEVAGAEMVTVFIPSSPTAFSGYVVVVPRDTLVELPLKVEEAMRMLVSGGVVSPLADGTPLPAPAPAPQIAGDSAAVPSSAPQAQERVA
jgi:uncharacterized membrane protein